MAKIDTGINYTHGVIVLDCKKPAKLAFMWVGEHFHKCQAQNWGDRTAIKVEFARRKGGDSCNGWNIRLCWAMEQAECDTTQQTAMGMDLNHGHFEGMLIHKDKDTFRLGKYAKFGYDTDAPSKDKKRVISASIREAVALAKENNAVMVLEALDFEGAKRTLRNKLGATLHQMPYRAIRDKMVRECAKRGVLIRFVSPYYTSLLGNVLATKSSLKNHQCSSLSKVG